MYDCSDPHKEVRQHSTDSLALITDSRTARRQWQAELAIEKGVKVLRGWMQSFDLSQSFAEQALEEVRTKIMLAEMDGRLKDSEIVWQGKPEEVFAHNVPAGWEKMATIDLLNAVVDSIGKSILELIPNSNVRLKVIDTALSEPRLLTTGQE